MATRWGATMSRALNGHIIISNTQYNCIIYNEKYERLSYRALMLHAEINQILGNFHKFKTELLS